MNLVDSVNRTEGAACTDADPTWFEATDYRQAKVPLTYCGTCPIPVVAACALLRDGSPGVWGGAVYGVDGAPARRLSVA